MDFHLGALPLLLCTSDHDHGELIADWPETELNEEDIGRQYFPGLRVQKYFPSDGHYYWGTLSTVFRGETELLKMPSCTFTTNTQCTFKNNTTTTTLPQRGGLVSGVGIARGTRVNAIHIGNSTTTITLSKPCIGSNQRTNVGRVGTIFVANNNNNNGAVPETYRVRFDDGEVEDYDRSQFWQIVLTSYQGDASSRKVARRPKHNYVCLQCKIKPYVYSLNELKQHTNAFHGGQYYYNKDDREWEPSKSMMAHFQQRFPASMHQLDRKSVV